MNDFKQQAQHITPKTNKKRPYGDYGDGKRLKMKFEELHVDDITYAQMKAIFDILGIDPEELLK